MHFWGQFKIETCIRSVLHPRKSQRFRLIILNVIKTVRKCLVRLWHHLCNNDNLVVQHREQLYINQIERLLRYPIVFIEAEHKLECIQFQCYHIYLQFFGFPGRKIIINYHSEKINIQYGGNKMNTS